MQDLHTMAMHDVSYMRWHDSGDLLDVWHFTCCTMLQKLRHISSIGCLRRTVRSWHGLIVLRHPTWLSGTHHSSWMENSRNAGSMCRVLLPSMMRHAMRCVTITSVAIVASAGMLMCIPSLIRFTNQFYNGIRK
jgi:hypothetical protein